MFQIQWINLFVHKFIQLVNKFFTIEDFGKYMTAPGVSFSFQRMTKRIFKKLIAWEICPWFKLFLNFDDMIGYCTGQIIAGMEVYLNMSSFFDKSCVGHKYCLEIFSEYYAFLIRKGPKVIVEWFWEVGIR